MQKDRRADLAVHPDTLHFGIGRIEAPHVADLDEPPSRRRLGRDNRRGLFRRGGERLFAKHRLARGDAFQGEVRMRGVRRRDHHRLHPVVVDQRIRIGEDRGAPCEDFGARGHRIADRRERGARGFLAQDADMFRPHHAGADDPDGEGHLTSSQRPSRLEAWIVSTRVWMRKPLRKLKGSGALPAMALTYPATSIALRSLKPS